MRVASPAIVRPRAAPMIEGAGAWRGSAAHRVQQPLGGGVWVEAAVGDRLYQLVETTLAGAAQRPAQQLRLRRRDQLLARPLALVHRQLAGGFEIRAV